MTPITYAITRVHYEGDEYSRRIVEVEVVTSNAGNPKNSELGISHFANQTIRMLSTAAADEIDKGAKFRTAPKSGATGADVHVVRRGGDSYLRTDHNDIPEDNLGDLDEY